METLSSLHFHSLFPLQNRTFVNGLGIQFTQLNLFRHRNRPKQLVFTACSADSSVAPQSDCNDLENNPNSDFDLKKSLGNLRKNAAILPRVFVVKSQETFQQVVAAVAPRIVVIKRQPGLNLILGFSVAIVCLVIAIRVSAARRASNKRPGSVADLVRRGQLRSDRRGISKPLKYEDPFNNPMVKVGNGNSTVEMCGKVYRLAPVTLTEEERAIHQKRRSRAYQWKRPKVFLKEGDSIPPDVDPESVRWIPANHPFATTVSDIDEDFAQTNVYQKHGVPFRIQAEHEALQKKLESLQSEQKFNNLVIDPANAKEFERAYKVQSQSTDRAEGSHNGQASNLKSPNSDQMPESLDSNANSA